MMPRKHGADLNPGFVISSKKLALIIRSRCHGELPGLEPLLLAALRLSVTPDETRHPRVQIRTSYKKVYPLVVSLRLPLDRLPRIAPAVHYPGCAILCTWDGSWEISGITNAILQHDGIGINITGPLCVSITLPDRPIPELEVIRGEVRYFDGSWETALARLGQAASAEANGGTTALVLARATYKVSIGRHGGAFLILSSDPRNCLTDISIGYPARQGVWFERSKPARGCMNSELVEEWSDALAALTGVDGAVVLNKDLSLLGFGATIKASTKDDPRFQGGHRHKSAKMLCEKYEGTVAIVVSQDGPVTVYGTGS